MRRIRIIIGIFLIAAVSTGVACSFASRASAQASDNKAVELLARAAKSYDAGAYTDATIAVEEAFKGSLDSSLAARAFLLRAQINEKSGKLSRALSDYSSAIWTEKLPVPEQRKANEGKQRVMGAMGLSGAAPAQSASSSGAPRPAAPVVRSAQAESSSGGGTFGFVSNLFGGGSSSSPPPAPPIVEPRPSPAVSPQASPAAQQAPAQEQSSSGGGVFGFLNGIFDSKPAPAPAPPLPVQTAAVEPAAAKPAVAAARQAPPKLAAKKIPSPKPSSGPIRQAAAHPVAQPASFAAATPRPAALAAQTSPGTFHIDFGGMNTEASAQWQAQQIKARLSDILVNRELLVQQGGSAFHVMAGPYKTKGAAAALCKSMLQRGVTCQVVQ